MFDWLNKTNIFSNEFTLIEWLFFFMNCNDGGYCDVDVINLLNQPNNVNSIMSSTKLQLLEKRTD